MSAIISASFKSKDVLPQNFPFSKPIMNYIFSNASPKLFKKFNKSCKYFFAKFEYNIVDYLRLMDYKPWFQVFDDFKFRTNDVKKFDLLKPNLWLTTEFCLSGGKLPFYQSVLPKIIRCDISRLYLYYSANLKFEYFTKLTESGKVEELTIVETKIVDSQNSIVPIEELFKYALNASAIMINPAFISKQTMKILNSSKHGCKLGDLSLNGINDMLDVDDFVEFIKNNFDLIHIRTGIDIKFESTENSFLFNNNLIQKLCLIDEKYRNLIM